MEKTNIYGVVLAGGKGTRMGNVEKPKQFMEVGGKPIIIHTLEKFVVNPQFERVIVLSPKQWITYTQDIIKKYILLSDKIDVIEGGATRNDTIMNAISHIEKFYGLDEETINCHPRFRSSVCDTPYSGRQHPLCERVRSLRYRYPGDRYHCGEHG